MRTKYIEYDEYHTSLDNLDYISSEGLFGAYKVLVECIECIECNKVYKATFLCEPKMDKRNLYPSLGFGDSVNSTTKIKLMMDILAYADGNHDVLSMANRFNIPMLDMLESIDILVKEKLLDKVI
jgi:aminopeptidase-like protein